MSAISDPPLRSSIQINIPRPAALPPEPPEAECAAFTSVAEELAVIPPPPESLEDTGISLALIEQLILKFLYFRGEVIGRDLASLVGLQYSLIDELLETLKRQHHVGIKK